jgi:hypothetical protein
LPVLASPPADKTLVYQVVQNPPGIRFRRLAERVQGDFRLHWRLVGIIDALGALITRLQFAARPSHPTTVEVEEKVDDSLTLARLLQ